MLRAIVLAAILAAGATSAAAAKDTRFWNLTANTITSFQLSPAGADAWGKDQTANNSDHSVDHDERLKLDSLPSGLYDARFTDKTGRTCVVPKLKIKAGAVVVIEEKILVDCKAAQ